MRGYRQLALGIVLAASTAAFTAAWAEETATIPYAKFAQTLQVIEAIEPAQRDHVLAGMAVLHQHQDDNSPVHLWVIDNGTRVDLPLNTENFWFGPVRQDWIARDLLVQTDQPRHTLKLSAGIWLAVPPGRTVSLAYLQEGVRQTNDVSRRAARAVLGYLAQFAVPSVKHVNVTLAGCCTGTLILRIGNTSRTLHQDAQGVIAIPDEALMDGVDGSIEASAEITKLDPV